MRIINVIEIVSGIPNKIESFPIYEDQLSEEIVDEAEKLFIEMILKKELEFNEVLTEEEKEFFLDEGYYDNKNGYELYIIWSEIN